MSAAPMPCLKPSARRAPSAAELMKPNASSSDFGEMWGSCCAAPTMVLTCESNSRKPANELSPPARASAEKEMNKLIASPKVALVADHASALDADRAGALSSA